MNLLEFGLYPLPLPNPMRPRPKQPQRIAEEHYQALSNAHIFSQYMLQHKMRDQLFMDSLTTFRAELKRIQKRSKLRRASLDWYLTEMTKLKQQFDHYIHTLRHKGLIQFTLPMELALTAARAQWFMHYQGPQIRHGWQRAGQGFKQLSSGESPHQP